MDQTKGGPHRGHAAGSTDVEKQASQLASDVKYKVKTKLGKDTKLNPAQVAQAYMKQLNASPAPAAVKALARKKLAPKPVAEQFTADDIVKESVQNAFNKVFVEGVKKEEVVVEATENPGEKKYKIRVTDKKTGNTYVRMATRAKIAELRANPNIGSVEMTGYGTPSKGEAEKGEQTAAVKSKRDYDGDGKKESSAKEHAGVVHNAIQRRKGGKPDGQDTSSVKEGKDWDGDGKKESPAKEYRGVVHNAIRRQRGLKADGQDTSSVKEEIIYEKEGSDDKDKKKITGKGVDNYKTKSVKVFPEVTEEVSSNIATGSVKKKEPIDKTLGQQNERTKQQEVQILQRKLQALRSSPRGSDPSIMASYEPEGENVQEVAPPGMEGTVKAMKKHPELSRGKTPEGKEKNVYALAWWMKNKGYKSHRKPSGAMKEETISEEDYDRMKDRRQEVGGVSANVDQKPARVGPPGPKKKPAVKDVHKAAMDIVRSSVEKKYGKGSLM